MVGTYIDLIASLSARAPPMFLFGGFAEDALLEGTLRRPHGDLDVLVRRDELAERLELARSLGFGALEVYYEPLPTRPLVMGGRANDLNLEFGVLDEDSSGFYFVAGTPEGQLHRVDLTDGLFRHPALMIEQTTVHVVSPLALLQMRAAFAQLGTFGPLREKDVAAQARVTQLLSEQDRVPLPPRLTRLSL